MVGAMAAITVMVEDFRIKRYQVIEDSAHQQAAQNTVPYDVMTAAITQQKEGFDGAIERQAEKFIPWWVHLGAQTGV